MRKNAPIIAYGTEDDRLRLAAVVKALGSQSGSAWLIEQVRTRYSELFGDLPPSATRDA